MKHALITGLFLSICLQLEGNSAGSTKKAAVIGAKKTAESRTSAYWTTTKTRNALRIAPRDGAETLFQIPPGRRLVPQDYGVGAAPPSWSFIEWRSTVTNGTERYNVHHKGWVFVDGMLDDETMSKFFRQPFEKVKGLGLEYYSDKSEYAGDDGCGWYENYYLKFDENFIGLSTGTSQVWQRAEFSEVTNFKSAEDFTIKAFAYEPTDEYRQDSPIYLHFRLRKRRLTLRSEDDKPFIAVPSTFTPGNKARHGYECHEMKPDSGP